MAGRVAWIGARARTPAPPLTAAVASAGAAPASSHFSAAATWPKLKPPAPPPRCWPLAAGGGATGCGLLTRVEPPCTPALGVTSSVTEAQTLARRLTLWCRMRGWARPAQHSRCPLHPCLTCITTRRCCFRLAVQQCLVPHGGCSQQQVAAGFQIAAVHIIYPWQRTSCLGMRWSPYKPVMSRLCNCQVERGARTDTNTCSWSCSWSVTAVLLRERLQPHPDLRQARHAHTRQPRCRLRGKAAAALRATMWYWSWTSRDTVVRSSIAWAAQGEARK